VGHSQFPRALLSGQPSRSRRWHPGCHRCLLKGCERWFLPHRPQARYCSPACQRAARSWRCWHSCQRFKATDHGKKLRRDQARRYRIRLRQRSSLTQPTPPDDDVELTSPVIGPLTSPGSEPPPIGTTAGEGQRPARISADSCGLPCHRPGCYVLFLPSARSPDQKFCSGSCRQALRRVRQRELRLRQRRRRGILARYVHHPGPPQLPHLTSSCIEDITL
jgi:predicted nucleic acid-binding Zn ribbon protein